MTGRRSLRLYYEACIPALLVVLLACLCGGDTSTAAEQGGTEESRTILRVTTCLLSLVALLHRLDWSDNGVDETHMTAEYRPSVDNGAVYGSLLVPMTLLAAGIGAGTHYLYPYLLMALAMSIAFTAHYHWLRIWHSTRNRWSKARLTALIGGIWLAAMVALGRAGKHLIVGKYSAVWMAYLLSLTSDVQLLTRKELVRSLPRSFTMGEAAVLSQGFSLVLMDLFGLQLLHRGLDGSDKRVQDRAHWEQYMSLLVLEAVVIALYYAVHVLARKPLTTMLGERARRGVPGLLLLCVVFGGCGALALALVSFISQIGATRWILGIVLGSRAHVALLAYWIVLLTAAGAVYVLAMAKGSVSGDSSKFALHVKRKAYHLLAALMFVPGLLYARPLLHLAFAVALAGFVAAECMRVLDIGPCSKPIDAFMRRFSDYRDAGPVVTAHFYLLLGCAVPVWLGGASSVASLAGVLSLGVADSAASLVGMRLGRVRWPGTTKTVEGTAAFSLCLLLAIGLVVQAEGAGGVSAGRWVCYAMACLVLGALEALTEQNDNLVVPLCMYALMQAVAATDHAAGLAAWLAYAAFAFVALLVLPRRPESVLFFSAPPPIKKIGMRGERRLVEARGSFLPDSTP